MIGRFMKIVCWLLLVTAFIVTGCHYRHKRAAQMQRNAFEGTKKDVLAYEPNAETIVVANDYARRAIGVTGGYQAWLKTKKLQADGVVTFYKPDGSFYLTGQHYEIYPWSNSIRISATEPQGSFVWELSRGGLEGGQSSYTGVGFPVELCSKSCYTELILDIITAPVRFLDKPVEFNRASGAIKTEGRWCHSIQRVNPDKTGIWSDAVFYQNTDSDLVDMIWFTDVGLAVRCYDYRRAGPQGVLIPDRIEIFRTDARGLLQQRLVKIDFK